MTRRYTFTAGLLVTSFTVALARQVAVPSRAVNKTATTMREDAVPGRAVAPGAPAGSRAPGADSSPAKKLTQIRFDRRPSAILKAWANPPTEYPLPKDFVGPLKPGQKDHTDFEIEAYQRNVTLGNWPAVKAFLKSLPEADAKAAYKHLLQSLQTPVAGQGQPMQAQAVEEVYTMGGIIQRVVSGGQQGQSPYQEQNLFSAEDLVGVAAVAPHGLDKAAVGQLGGILRLALAGPTVYEVALDRLKKEVAKPADQSALTRRQAAQLLVAAGRADGTADFLPTVEAAINQNDDEALNLLAGHALALHAKDRKPVHLEQAWAATQAVLASAGTKKEDKEESLRRAVDLAPKVRKELGQVWLDKSFTDKPERGMEILAILGATVSQGLTANLMNSDTRLKALQLQKTAVDALLKAAPDRAANWRDTLSLLAANWSKEADLSYQYGKATTLGPRMMRDPFGNIFYQNDDGYPYGGYRQPNQPSPISIGDVLEARPDEPWLALVADDLKPQLAAVHAQLYLKVGEEAKAFPFIERLATSHPIRAKELVNEFLRVWTQNHDPNGQRRYTNPYMFMFGFERRAEGIPLTRSKQERNLAELSEWVSRLRKLPVDGPDEELLAKAFTTSHSAAEVYRLELVEQVFGPLGGLKPKTLAELAQQMRENLAGVWRQPKVQQDKKTNRKPKDIQAEVLRGYALARATVDGARQKFPADWSLQLASASLLHDETNYRQEVAKSSKYAAGHDAGMAAFAKAAEFYAAKVGDLPEEEQTAKVYEQWFYASLGASDLQHLDEHKQPDLRQPPKIRAAILALPGDTAERHLSKFANALFTRMSAVNPAAKYRYLKCGFEIVGDHKQAAEARKVFDYYRDLVTEIKLETAVDGPDVVGHGKPFGVFVNLRHSREIERESGGFGRYLQNQNNMYFSYNYGRPTADYRDKFQAAATEALKEHFEVLSVTFQHDSVTSKASPIYGWRTTPYAYLLLKARGPQVDKLPPLRLDLDFLDTSGYVVIPVESPAVPIDAKPDRGQPRPARKVQVTQILDERQADKGKLVLEVKATALGLVPELDQLVDLAPDGFERVKVDDPGVSVAKFDQDADETAVVSERNWLITLQAKADGAERPAMFRFGGKKLDGSEMVFQRYHDADLVSAAEDVPLEREYGRPSRAWIWWAVGGGTGLALAGAALLIWRARQPKAVTAADWAVPETLTPFNVLGLLQGIEQRDGLTADQKADLRRSIASLERQYFAKDSDSASDLRGVAEFWVRQASRA